MSDEITRVEKVYDTIATLNEDAHDLIKIFPDRMVPVCSIVPIKPREESAPLCYVVDAKHLSGKQVEQLGLILYRAWDDECRSVEEAIEYIREQGLPLRCDHFSGVGTNNPAILFGLMDDHGFEFDRDDDDDPDFDDDDYDYDPDVLGVDDYDPVVLYDPVDGAIRDSQLRQICDDVVRGDRHE